MHSFKRHLGAGAALALVLAALAGSALGAPPSAPPGQEQTPPGQEQTPPGQEKADPANAGQEQKAKVQATKPGKATAPGQDPAKVRGKSATAPHGKAHGTTGSTPADANANANAGGSQGTQGSGATGVGQSSAAEPPSCNGTIHLGSGNGTDPKYVIGETVTVSGSRFDSEDTFIRWTVVDVNDGTTVASSSTSWSSVGGAFSLSLLSTSGLTDGHEYKVTVYWTEMLPNGTAKECHKSKNFFLVASATSAGIETTAAGGVTGGTTGSAGTVGATGGVAGVEATAPSGGGEAGGVAGAFGVLGEVAGGTLPFTGLPLWVIVLIALAAIAIGYALWRRSHAPTARDVV